MPKNNSLKIYSCETTSIIDYDQKFTFLIESELVTKIEKGFF